MFGNWIFRAWYNGRKEGKLGIPSKGEEVSAFFEQLVCKVALNDIQRIYGAWKKKDALFRGALQTCRDVFNRARQSYESKKQELKRDTTVGSMIPYSIITCLVGLGEFAVNIIIFRVFGENLLLTGLMAIVILIGLPVAGHHMGKSLKHGWKSLKENILFPCEALIVLSCLIAFAVLRKEYLMEVGGNFVSPQIAVWSFIGINLLLFVAAIVASYLAHDEDPDIYRLKKDFERAQSRYHQIKAQRNAWAAKQQSRAERVRNTALGIIHIYRTHNLRQRRKNDDEEVPVSFRTDPLIEFPSFSFDPNEEKPYSVAKSTFYSAPADSWSQYEEVHDDDETINP